MTNDGDHEVFLTSFQFVFVTLQDSCGGYVGTATSLRLGNRCVIPLVGEMLTKDEFLVDYG